MSKIDKIAITFLIREPNETKDRELTVEMRRERDRVGGDWTTVKIGSDRSSDIVLPSVRRMNTILEYDHKKDRLYVLDLGDDNTMLNDEPVKRASIERHDILKIGENVLTVERIVHISEPDALPRPPFMSPRAVYTIVERDGKSLWIRIGWAKVLPDGSFDVQLDALPINGRLQIREWNGTTP
jgi:hypothetical protein